MAYECKIVLDSVNPAGARLTTFAVTYPRMVHAEVMTHRMFSRGASSSRAVPVKTLIKQVLDEPVMPVWWGRHQSGMQAREEVTGLALEYAKIHWLHARDAAVDYAYKMLRLPTGELDENGNEIYQALHKQLVNRVLEPWMWITLLITSTEWPNFYHLRVHKDAQPEVIYIAGMMLDAYKASTPILIPAGGWHLPYIEAEDRAATQNYLLEMQKSKTTYKPQTQLLKEVSVGRCARVSYLTHEGKRDIKEDIRLHGDLLAGMATGDPIHMGPFEHVAQSADNNGWYKNFRGWRQYRSDIPGENYTGPLP